MDTNELIKYFSSLEKPLIIDGAMGSQIQEKGFKPDKDLWFSYLNYKHPNVIADIYKDYITSGCDILTTNTFRTNPRAFSKVKIGSDYNKVIKDSVEIAIKSRNNDNILIAGSNAPAEDCYNQNRTIGKNDLSYNHQKHIELLFDNGVDFILNETQSHLDEILIISNFCSNNNIPFVISLYVQENLKILSGQYLLEVIEIVSEFNPLFISFNCITLNTFNNIVASTKLNFDWGFYLNCGEPGKISDQMVCAIGPNKYADIVKRSVNLNLKMVGACCGSNPKHIKSINEIFYGTTIS